MHNMTPIQCRMARAALNWTIQKLADEASVSRNSVARFEDGKDARLSTVKSLRCALEKAGAQFTAHGVELHAD